MKGLIKQYLDQGISRRSLISGLSAAGVSAVAAKSMARSLAPFASPANAAEAQGRMRPVTGRGGALYVQQLKAAGVDYVFFNPSTGDAPIFDALVDEPAIRLIKGVQEGAVTAMADGYARLSGKPGVVVVANVGLPNAMTQMVNTFKDRIPMLVTVAAFGQEQLGEEGPQDYDFQEYSLSPITKWRWTSQTAAGIPETTRRALKFATTPPSGPVFLAIPENELRTETTAMIMDRSLFAVPMKIRPDTDDVEKAARMLVEARNPLLTVGDEITLCNGEKEVTELAELLGLPVAGQAEFGTWSKPFPTRSPLYLGPMLRNMQYPGAIDVHLNIGSRYAEIATRGATLISMRQDPTSLARVAPVDLPMVADVKLGTADLVAAIKSIATADRLRRIAAERRERTAAYTSLMAATRRRIATSLRNGAPVRLERLAFELESGLERDTIFVTDCDSGKAMDPLMSFGGDDKTYISTGPNILGWGAAAGFGAKLARPDRPVVAILGDGSMMFGGPQPLWSMSRYEAPVTVIVFNNKSYNNERNRIWTFSGGEQFRLGRDMTCYNGNPDVDFAKAAAAFGVEGETVSDPEKVGGALARAKRANVDGRPYLLDIHIQRDGIGAGSTYYPEYSIAAQRTRKV